MEKNTVFIAGKTAPEEITDSTGYLVLDPITGALLVSGAIAVTSIARSGSVTITRPATTPTYAAGAVIGDTNGSAIFELTNFGAAGEQIIITDINLEIDVASVPSGMGTFTVNFYNTSPTAIADNTVWSLVSGDRSKYLGFQQLYTPSAEGATLYSQNDRLSKSIILTGTSLFFELVTDASFIATSAAIKKLSVYGFAV